jgi:hypothetical protein
MSGNRPAQPQEQSVVAAGDPTRMGESGLDQISSQVETSLTQGLLQELQRAQSRRDLGVAKEQELVSSEGDIQSDIRSLRDLGQRVPGENPAVVLKRADDLAEAYTNTAAQIREEANSANVFDLMAQIMKIGDDKKKSKREERRVALEEKKFDKEMKESGLMYDENGGIVVDPDVLKKATKEQIEQADDLRSEFMGQQGIKDFMTVKTSHDKVITAEDSPAGDIAMIFNYMKTLDPNSVVREGEFATAQNSSGVPDAVRNMYNKAMSGQRLTSGQRDNFKKSATQQFNSHITAASERATFYKELAEERGLDPDDVIGVLGPLEKIAIDSIISEEDEDKKNKRKGWLGGILDSIFGEKQPEAESGFTIERID